MKIIATADWHLRLTAPACRTDEDYALATWKKVKWLGEFATKEDARVVIAGDVFDHWKASPELIQFAMECMDAMPDKPLVVAGQHDLPNHDIKQLYRSGLGVLLKAECIYNPGSMEIIGADYEQEPKVKAPVLVLHTMAWINKVPYKNCSMPSAMVLLKKYPWAKWIITGDNHKPFTVQHEGRWLINPGSLMRMDADQADHRPSVYLFDTESEQEPKRIYIPCGEGVVSRAHLTSIEEKNERLEEFVRRLDDKVEVGLSFTDNMAAFLDKNKVGAAQRRIIQEAMA